MSKNETLNTAAHAYQAGDERAFDIIYTRLVGAAEYYGRRFPVLGADAADLAQEALIALTLAARDWDSSRGAPFEAYAKTRMLWAVRNAHRKASRHASRTVYAPSGDVTPNACRDLAPLDLAAPALCDALRDGRDASIIRGLLSGDDYNAIGADLGITKQAVSLRVIAIRERVGR